jgi:hypothetical protein
MNAIREIEVREHMFIYGLYGCVLILFFRFGFGFGFGFGCDRPCGAAAYWRQLHLHDMRWCYGRWVAAGLSLQRGGRVMLRCLVRV